ncbi:MAG: LacI family transcriptional regulator [Anaerolineae bacterium]|nr:LacI family transcriptional regulator [Anaerolineae bacterium]
MNTSPEKKHSVTLMDVARASGVSGATVSRVLSGYEFVKESTRRRVLETVEQLGYVANLQARSLAGGRSQVIGLLVPNLGNSYVGTISRGVDHELIRANYDLMLYTSHRHPGKESFYANAIANGLTDGLLLIAPLVPATYLEVLREQNFPYVLIDQTDTTENSNVVESTNWQGAYDATCYLNQLGHTRIAFITGASIVRSAVDRLAGYKAALTDCNIPFKEELVVEGDYQQQTGYEVSKRLLQSVNPPPTAIFACNDLSAFGAMEAVRESGLRIPDDISIIGFDDIPQASLIYPKLTTVRQPLEQMGQVAVKILLECIEDLGRPTQHVSLKTELVIRDSCGPYKSQNGK